MVIICFPHPIHRPRPPVWIVRCSSSREEDMQNSWWFLGKNQSHTKFKLKGTYAWKVAPSLPGFYFQEFILLGMNHIALLQNKVYNYSINQWYFSTANPRTIIQNPTINIILVLGHTWFHKPPLRTSALSLPHPSPNIHPSNSFRHNCMFPKMACTPRFIPK